MSYWLITAKNSLAIREEAGYGGKFGAALGVILLAVLVVVINDSLIRLNALKQLISLAVNVSAAVVFLFWGEAIGQSAARSPLAFPQNSSGGS